MPRSTRDDATIVRTIIDMGKALEVEVVAEGVENEEQFNFLRSRGCHYAQGRLFGDAMSADEFLALLLAQAKRTRPRSASCSPRASCAAIRGSGRGCTEPRVLRTIPAPAAACLNSVMLSFSSLALRRGTRLLITDASFTIYRGEKVGIVGANGSGKSSLLALVLGELQPDAGSFDDPSQLVVAHVAQELDATDRPAIEFVMDGDAELRATEAAIAKAEARERRRGARRTACALRRARRLRRAQPRRAT